MTDVSAKLEEIRDRLDRVVDGEHEIGNLCLALSYLADLVEELFEKNKSENSNE